MKAAVAWFVVLALALTGCWDEPTDIVVREPEGIARVNLDGLSFGFPHGVRFEGGGPSCPGGASECPLADDSTQLVWRSDTVGFEYVVDPYGDELAGEQWGDWVTINVIPAYRKRDLFAKWNPTDA